MPEGTEAFSPRGVVAANPPEAAQIGAQIIRSGGNAMDAASAASMACCMLAPHCTGVGGYVCCAVVLEGKTGRVWSVDANSVAPAGAHEHMFELVDTPAQRGRINESEYRCSVKDNANVFGPLAVGPPGMMAGMGILWERWGKLKWEQIVAPSQKLLADGFPYRGLAKVIKNLEPVIRKFPATAVHLMPEGTLPKPEDLWHRPDMDKTLARVARAGWRDFYEGEIGHKIADYIQQAGGVLTREDMAKYRPRVTEPYTITYRNALVHGPILTNGAITALQILNMLDCLDLPAQDTVEYWHVYAEVLKMAWRDRLRYLGDPAFVDVPFERFFSKQYALGRTETLRQFPSYVDKLVPPPDAGFPHGTLHVSTADAGGNAVSITISHGGAFGSCVTVPGTGVILGHGMCRLDPRPGRANSVAPGKRPLNNTACLIVQSPDRDVALGLPGGRRLIAVSARAAHLLVDRHWTGREVAIAPRMHVTAAEPVELTRSAGEAVIGSLNAMGHKIRPVQGIAGTMNCAEVCKQEGNLRAGSGQSVAAV